ncbi:putative integral membrane protein [Rhizobium leguminosarum]|uniref:Putative integral membrane protein n=1 Tax=Rhizobium leguminosarum TaxID=384 RepID=A0A2Z4YG48_RHILE|nr:putative integral membrane protein [Rhizobium leguminosarum]
MVRDHDPGRIQWLWDSPHTWEIGGRMTQRTRTRKAISIILGLALVAAGLLGCGYMQFQVVEPISIKLWLIRITILAAGVAILWDDFKIPSETTALPVRRPSDRLQAGEKGK